MKEELISFETAKLAKEKGFEKSRNHYNKKGEIEPLIGLVSHFCPAPTQSLLQKWLREKHNHFVYITPVLNLESETEYKFTIYRLSDKFRLLFSKEKNTYEEALEAGLYKALKLI